MVENKVILLGWKFLFFYIQIQYNTKCYKYKQSIYYNKHYRQNPHTLTEHLYTVKNTYQRSTNIYLQNTRTLEHQNIDILYIIYIDIYIQNNRTLEHKNIGI